jgi:DNA polymerase elongation subunit (family B)
VVSLLKILLPMILQRHVRSELKEQKTKLKTIFQNLKSVWFGIIILDFSSSMYYIIYIKGATI